MSEFQVLLCEQLMKEPSLSEACRMAISDLLNERRTLRSALQLAAHNCGCAKLPCSVCRPYREALAISDAQRKFVELQNC